MERLRSKRTVRRAQNTRLINEANAVLETADLDNLKSLLERLTTSNNELRQINAGIEDHITDGDLVAEYTAVVEYDDEATRMIALLGSRASTLREKERNPPPPTPVSTQSTTSTGGTAQANRITGVKLPKLRLQTFNGDSGGWQSFWEQFSSAIHDNESVPRCQKFHYLRTLVTGPAAAAIAGLQATDACYDDAIEILSGRFGDRRRIEQDHLAKLRTLPSVSSSNDTRGLRRMYDHLQVNIRGLKALGVGSDTYSTMMADIILRALPKDLVVEYYRRTSSTYPTTSTEVVQQRHEAAPAASHGSASSVSAISTAPLVNGELSQILSFLRDEVENRERAGLTETTSIASRQNQKDQTRRSIKPTAAVLQTTTRPGCFFCKSTKHSTETCVLPLGQKKTLLSTDMRCFRCTKKGHRAKDCRGKVSCSACSGRHVTSMCDPNWKPRSKDTGEETMITSVQNASDKRLDSCLDNEVLLQTFRAWAVNEGDSCYFRAIIDGGSQRTFIRKDMSRKLNLKVLKQTSLRLITFGNENALAQQLPVVQVRLRSQYGKTECILEAIEIPFICKDITQVPTDYEFLRSVEEAKGHIADELLFPGMPARPGISMLIGSDQLWKITKDQVHRCCNNEQMTATNTIFGWTFQGPISLQGSVTCSATTTMCVLRIGALENNQIESTLRSFWELESIGITDQPRTQNEEHNSVYNEFCRKISKSEGRYEVCLPWRPNTGELKDNRVMAVKRLEALKRRLLRNELLAKDYDTVIRNYITAGHAEKVPTRLSGTEAPGKRLYYMPHQAVVRSESETTKLRVVFDASSHEPGVTSLNEHLEKGPKMNADLVKILIRFRLHPIAVTADIEKAFLQIGVRREDRDALRFLWFENEISSLKTAPKIEEWRMTRVPFGTSASPFLLTATLVHHLLNVKEEWKSTAQLLLESFYVDDLLIGAQSTEDAANIHDKAKVILEDAGMTLRKWSTNSRELQELIDEGSDTQFAEPKAVLGLRWRREDDKLMIPVNNILNFVSSNEKTKRHVLQAAARVFDPLGIIAPYVIRVKILFQRIWERGLDWDDHLPDDLESQWQGWCSELQHIQDVVTGRCIINAPRKSLYSLQLHIFCDASPLAYGTCAYLRVKDREGNVDANLILSKSRVAPIKRLTLPRLELMAAVIGSRMGHYLEDILICQDTFYWTDSTIVLHWIKGNANKWKPFVANRVTEIQSKGTPLSWKHCPGVDNPADLITRGITAEDLRTVQVWWKGPTWLSMNKNTWPGGPTTESVPNAVIEDERRHVHHALQTTTEQETPLLVLKEYSKLGRVLRITAWVMRFVKNCRKQNQHHGPLKTEELERAETYWITRTQREAYSQELKDIAGNTVNIGKSTVHSLSPFVDSTGLLRVGGRLQNANETERVKHPLLLPPEQPLTDLIVHDCHLRTLHGGIQDTTAQLRERFWVPRGRQIVKKIIHRCNGCARLRAKRASAPTAPLPQERVSEAAPFEVVGIDFAGPLFVKSQQSDVKAYIALFTCAVTRAVHLELVSNLSAAAFIMAFQRFTSRRALPRVVYTDNALTFKKASRDLCSLWNAIQDKSVQEHYSEHRITWKFIVERAAWWGGFWERMVRTVKTCLRKVLGKDRYNFEKLTTILHEVESIVNSRPLTFLHASSGEQEVLTPAHFLTGKRLTSLPTSCETNPQIDNSKDITRLWKHHQRQLDHFWTRWRREYLLQLRSAHESPNRQLSKIRAGDLVLVEEEKTPRHLWRTGRVQELFYGKDGVVRSCSVALPSAQVLKRPVQLLYPLELVE